MNKFINAEEEKKIKAKYRLIGSGILVLLVVIFIPKIFDSEPRKDFNKSKISIKNQEELDNLINLKTKEPNNKIYSKVENKNNKNIIENLLNEANNKELVNEKNEEIITIIEAKPKINLEDNPIPIKKIENSTENRINNQNKSKEKQIIALLENKKTINKKITKQNNNQNKFVVQLGSFSELTTAEKLREKLKQSNINSFIQNFDTMSGKYSRVRVGPFNSKEEAESQEAKLKLLGFTTAKVMAN